MIEKSTTQRKQILKEKFLSIRKYSETLYKPLVIEDYSVQPEAFVSPPKWHLAHVTWFWETFVLGKYLKDYKVYHKDFSFLFNSYYNNVGERVLRLNRGLITRPTVQEIFNYRNYVTAAMENFFSQDLTNEVLDIIEIGLNHEEQHQELFVYDIKYIYGNQPVFPKYNNNSFILKKENEEQTFIQISEGIYEIGHNGEGFSFDNELGRHKVYLNAFEISNQLVTNKEFIDFIEDGGYQNFNFWHDDAWHWLNNENITAPLYWKKINDKWYYYDLDGFQEINLELPLNHVSYYEAFAFAEYKNMRLPTEAEWEVACDKFNWGQVWEWTNSAYLPYPNFSKASGALGEYNGKFMVNTMVMRGASVATPNGHSRKTYRNFFHPNMRWQFSGIRLIKK